MYSCRKIKEDLVYVGVEDRRIPLFENIFPLERGVTYNSYLLLDEKTVLMDTCDQTVATQFFQNLEHALSGRKLDYLLIHHMEPDHCGCIEELYRRFPGLSIISNSKTFQILEQFFSLTIPEEQKVVVKDGEEFSFGKHQYKFLFAPMVHWPEVMFSYDEADSILFSADAFGVFGCNNGNIFAKELDYKAKDFLDDARRYYANIVGKYGTQTQMALKKAAALPSIKMICPLHGPIWQEESTFILEKYDLWSRYVPEETAVVIIYNSIYGNTESVVNHFAMRLGEKGVRNCKIYDVSKTDFSYLIAEVFRASHLVFAATTYNNGLFPKMESLLNDMKNLNVQNRKVAILENGTWAPQSAKLVKEILDKMKDMTYIGEPLTIKSAAVSMEALEKMADAVTEDYQKVL